MDALNGEFLLGGVLVQPSLNRVEGPGGHEQLEPRVMKVLVYLTQHAGEVVTRNELLDNIWSDTVVNDDSLTRSISDLRKGLGDDPLRPRYIETIRSVGYRLIAPVDYDVRNIPSIGGHWIDRAASTRPVPQPARIQPHPLRLAWIPIVIIVAAGGLVWLNLVNSPASLEVPFPSVPVTTLPGVETDPAFSPDGGRIAFSWSGRGGDHDDIYVKLIDDENLLRLSDSPAHESSPVWSPDGGSIAFLRTAGDDCEIFLVPALGGPERKLANCIPTREANLTWSADGKWLALPMPLDSESQPAIFLVSVDGQAARQLTFPEQTVDLYPAFSPDGSRISFIRFTSERVGDLYVVSMEGGETRRLTFDNRFILGHDWTPDGRRIVFSSNRAGDRRLWGIPESGGAPKWLGSLDTYDPASPVFSRDSGRLAYVEWFLDYNIWEMETGGSDSESPSRLIASSRWDRHPSLSPDDLRIAFTSNRSGRNEVWVCDRRGESPIRLTSFEGAYVSTPRWSPSGRFIVFEARKNSHADLYVIGVEGGAPRQLTSAEGDELAPSWSRDGGWIYFASNRSGEFEVWKVSPEIGHAEQVTQAGGFAAFESPDGRHLYFTKPTTAGIWRRSVAGGHESQVLSSLWTNDWGNWALGKDGIYFVQRRHYDRADLSYYDFKTGEIAKVGSLPSGFPVGAADLSVSWDGATILYSRIDRLESDIMLVEGFQ